MARRQPTGKVARFPATASNTALAVEHRIIFGQAMGLCTIEFSSPQRETDEMDPSICVAQRHGWRGRSSSNSPGASCQQCHWPAGVKLVSLTSVNGFSDGLFDYHRTIIYRSKAVVIDRRSEFTGSEFSKWLWRTSLRLSGYLS